MRPATFALVGVLIGGSCFLGLGRGLWTPDEPREAGISREMYIEPSVIPTLNGEPFIEKPPLYYWATAFAFHLTGGPNAPAARTVSAIAGLLALAVVFVWVRRASSFDAAAIAITILATSTAFVTSVHWLRMDALLLLFCTIAVWAAWERIGRAAGPKYLILFYAGVVLALWTKGLIGPVLIAAGLLTFAAISRSARVLVPLRPVAGIIVVGVAVAGLAATIAAEGGASALRTWFWVNHVERFVHPVATGHERPFAYYAWTLPVAVAPWIVPFASLFRFGAPLWRSGRADALLLRFAAGMVGGPLVALSLASSKREVYLLPLFPPLALLLASATLGRIEAEHLSPPPGRWTRTGDWLQAAILGVLGLAPALAHARFRGDVTLSSLVLLAMGLASAAWLFVAVARRDALRAFWIGAASMGVALAGIFVLAVPTVDTVKDFAPYLTGIDHLLPAGQAVPVIGADETLRGIVPFVTGRRVIPVDAHDLKEAPFVLVQSLDRAPSPTELEPDYERLASREFGPSRRMELWRRRVPSR